MQTQCPWIAHDGPSLPMFQVCRGASLWRGKFCSPWCLCKDLVLWVLDNCNWGQFLRKNLSLASLHTGFSGLRASEGKNLQFQLLESINIFHKVSCHCLKKQTPKAMQFLHVGPLFRVSFKGWNEEWSYFPALTSHTAGMRLFTYTHHTPPSVLRSITWH